MFLKGGDFMIIENNLIVRLLDAAKNCIGIIIIPNSSDTDCLELDNYHELGNYYGDKINVEFKEDYIKFSYKSNINNFSLYTEVSLPKKAALFLKEKETLYMFRDTDIRLIMFEYFPINFSVVHFVV